MRLQELLDKKNMSVLRCSQESHIPYSTLADIVKGKTPIEKQPQMSYIDYRRR